MNETPRPPFKFSTVILIFLGLMALMILVDPSLRMEFGTIAGYVLYPAIGFGGQFVTVTLLLAGAIMSAISIITRHLFIDWVELARSQKVLSEFNKVRRKALLARDMNKVQKLSKIQAELMQDQGRVMQSQLKTMAITMFAVLVIFAWLASFIYYEANSRVFSVPWSFEVSASGTILVFPVWILLYGLLSMPLSLTLPRILKYFSFKRKLEEKETV